MMTDVIGREFNFYMGRRTIVNMISADAQKLNMNIEPSDLAKNVLRNSERTAKEFYIVPEQSVAKFEALDVANVLRYAHKGGFRPEIGNYFVSSFSVMRRIEVCSPKKGRCRNDRNDLKCRKLSPKLER